MDATFSLIDEGTVLDGNRTFRSAKASSIIDKLPSVGARNAQYENYNVEIDDGFDRDTLAPGDGNHTPVTATPSTSVGAANTSSTIEVPTIAKYHIKEMQQGGLSLRNSKAKKFVIRNKQGDRVVVDKATLDEVLSSVSKSRESPVEKDTFRKEKTTTKALNKSRASPASPILQTNTTKWQDEVWRSSQQYSQHKPESKRTQINKDNLQENTNQCNTESSIFSFTKHAIHQQPEQKESESASKVSSTFSFPKHALHRDFPDQIEKISSQDVFSKNFALGMQYAQKDDKHSSASSSTFSLTKHAYHETSEDHNHHKHYKFKKASSATEHVSTTKSDRGQAKPLSGFNVPSPIIWFAGGPLLLSSSRSASLKSTSGSPVKRGRSRRRIHTISSVATSKSDSRRRRSDSPRTPTQAYPQTKVEEPKRTRSQLEWIQTAEGAMVRRCDLARFENDLPDLLGFDVREHHNAESEPLSQSRPDLFYKNWPPVLYQEERNHARKVEQPKSKIRSHRQVYLTALRASEKHTAGHTKTRQSPDNRSSSGETAEEWPRSEETNDPDVASVNTVLPWDSASQQSPQHKYEDGVKIRSKEPEERQDQIAENETKSNYRAPTIESYESAKGSSKLHSKNRNIVASYRRGYFREDMPLDLEDLQPGESVLQPDERSGWIIRTIDRAPQATVTTWTRPSAVDDVPDSLDSSSRRTRSNLPPPERRHVSSSRGLDLSHVKTPPREGTGSPKHDERHVVAHWDVVEVQKLISSSDATGDVTSWTLEVHNDRKSPLKNTQVLEETSAASQVQHRSSTHPSRLHYLVREDADASWDMVDVLASGDRSKASWKSHRIGSNALGQHDAEAEQTYAWRKVTESVESVPKIASLLSGNKSIGAEQDHRVHLNSVKTQEGAKSGRSHVSKRSKAPKSRVVAYIEHPGTGSQLPQHSKAMTQAPGEKVAGWDDGFVGPVGRQ